MRRIALALFSMAACTGAKVEPPGGATAGPTTAPANDPGPEKPDPPVKSPTDGGTKKPDPPAATPFAKDDRAAVKTALAASGGYTLDDNDCVEWPRSFERVVVVGSFAHDRGCETMGVFVDRTWYGAEGETTAGGATAGLATRNFAAAAMADKELLARAWVDEVEHAFGGGFVTTAEPAFELAGSPAFAAVVNRLDKLGGVVVEGWTRDPSGMQDETAYTWRTYRITREGAVSHEAGKRFAVDGPRLRAHERTKPR